MAGEPSQKPDAAGNGTRLPGDGQRAEGERPIPRLLFAAGGFIAWAAQFAVIYGVAGVACARGYDGVTLLGIGLVPFTILAATVLALAAAGFVILSAARERRRMDERTPAPERFLNTTALLVGGLAAVSILWQGLPALLGPAVLLIVGASATEIFAQMRAGVDPTAHA